MILNPSRYAELSLLAANSYVKYVLNGKQPSNIWIKAAVERGVDDRKSDKWVLRYDILEQLYEFCSRMRIPDAQGKVSQFILSPYQAWMLMEIFLYYNEDGSRRITEIVYFTGRKSGKTMFAAIIEKFMVLEQDYSSPQAYFAASGTKQASILLDYCKDITKDSKYIRVRSDTQAYKIKYYNGGKAEAVANKTGGELDGLKPLVTVLDECHALPDNALRSAFTRGMGWSTDTLFLSISTAGVNITNYFYKQVKEGKKLLETKSFVKDEKTAYFLFTLDDGDLDREDLTKNKDLWLKANPNLGITPPMTRFVDDINKAWLMDEDKHEFIVKNFNVFNDEVNADRLFSMTDINRNIAAIKPEDFFGCDIYLGLDLAPKIDISAIGAVVEKDGQFYSWSDLFCAGSKDALFRKGTDTNLLNYEDDISINYGQEVTDYDAIVDRFQWYLDNFNIIGVGYDAAWSSTIVSRITRLGIDIYPVKQYHVSYNEVVLMMENLLAEDKLTLSDNFLQKYCFYNCLCEENNKGMRMFGKKISKIHGDAIDAVVAIMTAFNQWIGHNVEDSAIAAFIEAYESNLNN